MNLVTGAKHPTSPFPCITSGPIKVSWSGSNLITVGNIRADTVSDTTAEVCVWNEDGQLRIRGQTPVSYLEGTNSLYTRIGVVTGTKDTLVVFDPPRCMVHEVDLQSERVSFQSWPVEADEKTPFWLRECKPGDARWGTALQTAGR